MPATKTIIQSRLRIILPAIQQRLMFFKLDWPKERVRIAHPRFIGDNHPHGDGYLLLWPQTGGWNLPDLEGGGRTDARLTRTILLSMRTRFGADEGADQEAWLIDATLGHSDVEEACFDSLLLFQPTDTGDDTGNWLVTQPIVPRAVDTPESERIKDPDWGESRFQCDVTYYPVTDQGYQ